MTDFNRIKQWLRYDPETGLLYWIKRPMWAVQVGDVAGSKHHSGYVYIKLSGKPYAAHRLAWLLSYGHWPTGEIDHINRDRSDNRIKNLRAVNRQQNQQNRVENKNNTSGRSGVSFDKTKGRWKAYIILHRKYCHLGYYDSYERAVTAREAAEKKHFGSFKRLDQSPEQA